MAFDKSFLEVENPAQMLERNKPSILDLFVEQVQKAPQAIAVIDEDIQLTYLELDQHSNRLAHFLIAQGVKQNTCVGICVKSDYKLLVGILGILKAGAVYLPLDPSYPSERLQFMLNDAKPSVLLTQSNLMPLFPSCQSFIIAIENVWEEKCFEYPQGFPPQITIDFNHLAYIIYTSGSTGQPKGIMVMHGSFPQIVLARKDYYPTNLIGLLLGSISFDVTILTIFHLLISGGTICLPHPEAIKDMDKLINLIQKRSVNYILTVPSLYTKMLEKSSPLYCLKNVSLVGESIPNLLPNLHAALVHQAILFNEYGPSEYAVGATIAKIYDPITRKLNPVTIGKPLPNTHVYILDEQLQECPIQVKGEIFIGGPGLALGYLNNPELTNEKFIMVALQGREPERLYRTGDFGRYLSNGNLEFL